MEEIDRIIIDSLNNLNCDLDDNIQSLKEFNADLIVRAVSLCLEAICKDSGLKLPKKLPCSMSQKLNVASNLARHIKDLGFRGDMGYQTILYCNEVEIRRVLMFLIERLPKDTSKVVEIEQSGYVPRVVRRIEENIKNSMKHIWLPTCVLNSGTRVVEQGYYIVNSLGNCSPLYAEKLKIPDSQSNDENLRQYNVRSVPIVTKQCSTKEMVPSLLFCDDSDFGEVFPTVKGIIEQQNGCFDINQMNSEIKKSLSQHATKTTESKIEVEESSGEVHSMSPTKLQVLLEEFSNAKLQFLELQNGIERYEAELSSLKNKRKDYHETLKLKSSKVKLKTKASAILNNQENKEKLKKLIQNGSDRLVELANQWNEVQTPLLEEYKSLRTNMSSEELKIRSEQEKLKNFIDMKLNLEQQLEEKSQLEKNLMEKCRQISKHNSRVAYTRRIMEIVGNIKKQNIEIDKILQDSRNIQKDINTLTGQVDRSFTLSDELIFFDAKQDDTARKAYKLLAILRDEFNAILKAVDELGQIERESRNLQEQVESEKNKEIGVKLDRVLSDIEQIKREIATFEN